MRETNRRRVAGRRARDPAPMDTTAIASRDTTVAARPGYDPTPARTVARVRPMLDEERVVWLSTVRPDGTPHLVPTWFLWDGEALLVCPKPGAVKVRNLRANPRLMVAVGDPRADFSVGLIEAEASCPVETARRPGRRSSRSTRPSSAQAGLDAATFRATYTQAIRIVPTRYLAVARPRRGARPAAGARRRDACGAPAVRRCAPQRCRRAVPRAPRRGVLAPRPLSARPPDRHIAGRDRAFAIPP